MPMSRAAASMALFPFTMGARHAINRNFEPCSGRYRLRGIRDHIYEQWGITRWNDPLHRIECPVHGRFL